VPILEAVDCGLGRKGDWNGGMGFSGMVGNGMGGALMLAEDGVDVDGVDVVDVVDVVDGRW
jgi:hypothetical protein